MFPWLFNHYPGTDYETFNWEWVLNEIKGIKESVTAAKSSANSAKISQLAAAASASEAAQYADQAKWPVYTPEMYGAVGDGLHDDTSAIQNMFDDAKSKAPLFHIGGNDHYVSDMTGAKFIFDGEYKISAPINIYSVRGLVIEGANISVDTFTGTAMFKFGYDIRSSAIKNCTFNANHIAPVCIAFTDYTLAVEVDQCTIMKFRQYGISASGNGHEITISDCKVYQYEYAEWNSDEPKSNTGIGIYFDGYRADNFITGTIVNYCVEYGLYIATGPNIITGCHIYSCPCYFGIHSVNVSNTYFDNSQVELMGGASVRDSFFYIYGNTHAITLKETIDNKWRYETSWITGNIINNVNGEDNWSVSAIIIENTSYTLADTQLAVYDNSVVQYATQNNVPSSGKRMTPATVPITTDFLANANITTQLNALNTNATPEQVTLTGSNGFVIDVDKTYKIGKILIINLVGHATQNITGTGTFINLGSNPTIANGSTFICGKGTRWAASGVQTVYMTAYGLNGDVNNGDYLHINAAIPLS